MPPPPGGADRPPAARRGGVGRSSPTSPPAALDDDDAALDVDFSDDAADVAQAAAALRRDAAAALADGDTAAASRPLRRLLRLTASTPECRRRWRQCAPTERAADRLRQQMRAAALRGLSYVAAERGHPSGALALLRRSAALTGPTTALLLNALRLRALCGEDCSEEHLELAERAAALAERQHARAQAAQGADRSALRRAAELRLIAYRERAAAVGRLVCSEEEVSAGSVGVAVLLFGEAEDFARAAGLPQHALTAARERWLQSLPPLPGSAGWAQQQQQHWPCLRRCAAASSAAAAGAAAAAACQAAACCRSVATRPADSPRGSPAGSPSPRRLRDGRRGTSPRCSQPRAAPQCGPRRSPLRRSPPPRRQPRSCRSPGSWLPRRSLSRPAGGTPRRAASSAASARAPPRGACTPTGNDTRCRFGGALRGSDAVRQIVPRSLLSEWT
eukprot:TRINITY_DN16943_c2_g1_i1.p1 TRINITY_DN16943_c2_g1~~TRINITY_DN16943_c2_g1_i1.p1  ORF type:complete len:473 (+),score=133.37 TRINITY_DN16943_c2_g1_i1:79-1419(+)